MTDDEAVVVCQCSECDCERTDKGLSYATSSLLVCIQCCKGQHRYLVNDWCVTCGQRLTEKRHVHSTDGSDMKPRSVAEFLRDQSAARAARTWYRQRAAELRDLAKTEAMAGHAITARRTRYNALLADHAADAEVIDPEPRR